MKIAFIVTSSIDVDNQYPLTYSQVRSHFSSEERLRQTLFTVNSLDLVRNPELDIFVIDASDNYDSYEGVINWQRRCKFISVKKLFPEIYHKVRTHNNKSHCETTIVKTFMEKFYDELRHYDYICKLSGRYFIDGSFSLEYFTPENTDKLFFKNHLSFDWNDNWGYQMVDRRALQGDNKLYQYSSVLYGWGSQYLDKMLDINRVICEITGKENSTHYDIETLLYFFTREFERDIIHVPWTVNGWDGVNGRYLKY